MRGAILPLALALLGTGAGAGAGLYLRPAAEGAPDAPAGEADAPDAAAEAPDMAGEHAEPAADDDAARPADANAEGEPSGGEGHDYVRLDNQFVVPVVENGDVASLVILSLSVEVPAGGEDAVLTAEPKLRDAFLQVLFDHANTGGFDGLFTATSAMRSLRAALLAAAADEIGPTVTDVLITDLVRQDQ